METFLTTESEGQYRLVPSELFEHAISALDDYGDKSQNPLVSFLIDQLAGSREITLRRNIEK